MPRSKDVGPKKPRKPEKNHAEVKGKKVALTGAEVYYLRQRIEKIPIGARSVSERRLLKKLRD